MPVTITDEAGAAQIIVKRDCRRIPFADGVQGFLSRIDAAMT